MSCALSLQIPNCSFFSSTGPCSRNLGPHLQSTNFFACLLTWESQVSLPCAVPSFPPWMLSLAWVARLGRNCSWSYHLSRHFWERRSWLCLCVRFGRQLPWLVSLWATGLSLAHWSLRIRGSIGSMKCHTCGSHLALWSPQIFHRICKDSFHKSHLSVQTLHWEPSLKFKADHSRAQSTLDYRDRISTSL